MDAISEGLSKHVSIFTDYGANTVALLGKLDEEDVVYFQAELKAAQVPTLQTKLVCRGLRSVIAAANAVPTPDPFKTPAAAPVAAPTRGDDDDDDSDSDYEDDEEEEGEEGEEEPVWKRKRRRQVKGVAGEFI